MNIVIPMAGDGRRFAEAGYEKPKPLIDILGRPMIERVLNNIEPDCPHDIILIHQLGKVGYGDIEINTLPTRGAVDTIMKAERYINDEPLLIANCDQLADIDINKFISTDKDGSIVTFQSTKPHHSYVELKDGIVTRIAEKDTISFHAVTGIYYFKHGSVFVEGAKEVLNNNILYNNEFYVSSVIDVLIKRGYKFDTYDAPSAMLGTPEELQLFLMAAEVAKTAL